jgi:hypothetical protein
MHLDALTDWPHIGCDRQIKSRAAGQKTLLGQFVQDVIL